MIYFSGFCLQGEAGLFADWLVESDYSVAGFSLGAIRALEFAHRSESRVDRLLLFSPAFFQTRPERFALRQLRAWDRNPEGYRKQFFQNCTAPSDRDLSPYASEGMREELSFLLSYRWEEEKLRSIRERGTVIEVFIGEKDRIIDGEGAIEFFTPKVDALYRFRHAGHILMN